MTYRTYKLRDGEADDLGAFVSLDLSQHTPPTEFIHSWEISQAAYEALRAHRIPSVTPAGLDIDGDTYP
jgi:hypothetical protein